MSPPRLANPNVIVENHEKWKRLQEIVQANVIFEPVEIKTFYIIGLMDDICKSVQCLLECKDSWPEKYLPAFSLFASSVDLLGRCLTGNKTVNLNQNLKVGFWYLFHPEETPVPKSLNSSNASDDLLESQGVTYSVNQLVALRHFCAHGQATTDALPAFDNKLLSYFPDLMGDAMETYWYALQEDPEYSIRMGAARIDPYKSRYEPLSKTLKYFSSGLAIGELFSNLNWDIV